MSYLLNGQNFSWTFEVKNNSQGNATGVSVALAYPAAGVTILSTSASQGSYAAGIWTVGNLGPGDLEYITVYAEVTDHTLQPFTATGAVSIAETESNVGDNVISKTVGSADPLAACNITGACLCGRLPECDIACGGDYEYRLVDGSETNAMVILSPSGAYRVVPKNAGPEWSFQYTVHCCGSALGCPSCVSCGAALIQCSIAGSVLMDCSGVGFTVNAGTTSDATDNALGEVDMSICGSDTLHFYSPDGSVGVTVTAGSAVIALSIDIVNFLTTVGALPLECTNLNS